MPTEPVGSAGAASTEAREAAERVNQALDALCVHGLTNSHGKSNKWDCSGCTRDVVAAEVDRSIRAALERAAKVADRVKERSDEVYEDANTRQSQKTLLVMRSGAARDIASQIRALLGGE